MRCHVADEELERLLRRADLAIARARVADEEPHRDRLLSVDDIEEITGRTAALIDEKLKPAESQPEVALEKTANGFALRGSSWAVVVIVLVLAALAALKLFIAH